MWTPLNQDTSCILDTLFGPNTIQTCTVKPPIKDTPKKDKPPNKGQAKSTRVYTLYRESPLKEDNLGTKDKMAGPKGVFIERFHRIISPLKSGYLSNKDTFFRSQRCPHF